MSVRPFVGPGAFLFSENGSMKRFFSRLVSVFKAPNKGKRSMKLEQRRRFFRPQVEGLEGRSLLATLSIGDVIIEEEDGLLR